MITIIPTGGFTNVIYLVLGVTLLLWRVCVLSARTVSQLRSS